MSQRCQQRTKAVPVSRIVRVADLKPRYALLSQMYRTDQPPFNGPVLLSMITLWGVTADVRGRQDNERSSSMRTIDANTLSGSARDTAGSTSSFANVVHCLVKDLFSGYRPELHYMRGPGPKWRTKHQLWSRSD